MTAGIAIALVSMRPGERTLAIRKLKANHGVVFGLVSSSDIAESLSPRFGRVSQFDPLVAYYNTATHRSLRLTNTFS